MPLFINDELEARNKAHESYRIAQRRTDYAVGHAKLNARLLIARPETLLACFGVGAYRGATTSNPPSKRRQALLAFARTAFFNFVS